ncbi:putative membrane protein YesL [Scopulibacillus darangshiensis]|uniref:Putative membrane protein YesL n=1 Tax=Scopulibacillus darangshiensis TaxID=442528 RepID=A0A4R2NP61_9BACL|nr:YesL family protein [Scopulibacillus darangshiensis]TCP23530.1 putative membrane protein YesL [Scopulibacillus darangshiensis]
MEYKGWLGSFYRIAEWIMLLAYVNILWILFTAMGLIVMGVFPSTVGVYTVVRKWIIGDDDVPIWKTFWNAYRTEFVKANAAGYLFVLIGLIIFIDLRFFESLSGLISLILSYAFLVFFIFHLMMWLFFFPVFVHYDLTIPQYIKQIFLVVILRPLEAILAAAGGIAVYYLMLLVPGLIPFFAMSVMAFALMWIACRAFSKLKIKVEEQNQG